MQAHGYPRKLACSSRRHQGFSHVSITLKIETSNLVPTNSLADPGGDEMLIGDKHGFLPPIRQGFLFAVVRRLDYRIRIGEPQAPGRIWNGNAGSREGPEKVVVFLWPQPRNSRIP